MHIQPEPEWALVAVRCGPFRSGRARQQRSWQCGPLQRYRAPVQRAARGVRSAQRGLGAVLTDMFTESAALITLKYPSTLEWGRPDRSVHGERLAQLVGGVELDVPEAFELARDAVVHEPHALRLPTEPIIEALRRGSAQHGTRMRGEMRNATHGLAACGIGCVRGLKGLGGCVLPSPGAEVAGVSPVPVQMWQRCAQSRCRCGSGTPSPGADVAAVRPVPE